MPDLGLSVTVSRALLGLADLELNDHITYYASPTFLGGQVAWNRVQVTSPFIDGAVTVSRARQMVTEQLGVEVIADTGPHLKAAIDVALDAFLQDRFILTVTADSAVYRYTCEAADYQVAWAGPRLIARRAQLVLSVLRQPVALAGTA